MKQICATCKYNTQSYDEKGNVEFCCDNEDSINYLYETFGNDTCDNWERRTGADNA